MSQADSFAPYALAGQPDEWAPGGRVRWWLLIGSGALAIDLVLVVAAAVLERKHWGQPGLTPDVLLQYVALIPQALIVAAYLSLARDAQARGLWKSAAGLFAAYLLLTLLSLVLLEIAQEGAAGAVIWTIVIGIVGLSIYTFSKFPRIADRKSSAGGAESAAPSDSISPAANEADDEQEVAGNPPQKVEKPAEEGVGCWFHIALGIGPFTLKGLARGRKNWLGNLGVDGWTLIVAAILAAFAIGYACWFAAAKVRCRDRLGGMAAVTGLTEAAIVLVHVAMAAVFLYALATAIGDPHLDPAKFEERLDPWLLRFSLASTACHALWVVVTFALFTALRMRGEPDWRAQFVTPDK